MKIDNKIDFLFEKKKRMQFYIEIQYVTNADKCMKQLIAWRFGCDCFTHKQYQTHSAHFMHYIIYLHYDEIRLIDGAELCVGIFVFFKAINLDYGWSQVYSL